MKSVFLMLQLNFIFFSGHCPNQTIEKIMIYFNKINVFENFDGIY